MVWFTPVYQYINLRFSTFEAIVPSIILERQGLMLQRSPGHRWATERCLSSHRARCWTVAGRMYTWTILGLSQQTSTLVGVSAVQLCCSGLTVSFITQTTTSNTHHCATARPEPPPTTLGVDQPKAATTGSVSWVFVRLWWNRNFSS